MKRKVLIVFLGIVFLAVVLLSSSLYVVDMTEQVVITQFGDPVGEPIKSPGLKIKMPFIQKVNRFDNRVLEWDGRSSQVNTLDKKYIWVDTFARWKISDPLKFMRAVTDEIGGQARLDDVIDSATRDEITNHNLIELVRDSNRKMQVSEATMGLPEAAETVDTGRSEVMEQIQEKVAAEMPQYGIELVDVQFKRINYVEKVRQKVYARMISERQRMAERYRSEGRGERAEVLGKKEKELRTIESKAYEKAQVIKGKADAEATKIYAQAYGKDPGFYSFLRTLESYRETLGGNTSLIFTTESEYFAPLKKISPHK